MRFGGVRRTLAIAMALLLSRRALALVLGSIGSLAVLLLLSLQLHLTLLHRLSLSSLLHGDLLSLLRVHARPETTDIAGRLILAAKGVWVDKGSRRAVGVARREKHGWRHGGGLGLVEVHTHLGIHVDTRRPATGESGVHVHVDSRVEAIHHLRLVHGHALEASNGQADLLLVLGVVVARAIEVLALLGLVEGRKRVPVLASRLRRGIRA